MSRPAIDAALAIHTDESWIRGFAIALAETHRRDGNSSVICEVARDAGLSLHRIRAVGVDAFDWKELRRAGLR